MSLLERYVFRTASSAFLIGLATLTLVIWVTQALKQLDLMTTKGQTILIFLWITGLGLPFLFAVIAPVALFASVLYCLNRLNGDSELIVMSAAGVSPSRLMKPFAALSGLVFFGLLALHVEIIPRSFDAINGLTSRIHADFIANFARAGAFSELEAGFVFHYRERGGDGSLRGVFIQDRRDPTAISTYIAETGQIVEKEGDIYLLLLKGSVQAAARLRAIPRSSPSPTTRSTCRNSRARGERKNTRASRPFRSCFPRPTSPPRPRRCKTRSAAEIVDRLTSPLYALAAGMIGFAALGEPRTTRQGRGWAILAAILIFAAVRILGVADSLLMRGKGGVGPAAMGSHRRLGYSPRRRSCRPGFRARRPVESLGVASAPRRGRLAPMIFGVLGRYFAARFVSTVLAVFASVFALIFTLDLVETLRRSGEAKAASAPLLAWLAFLHTPIVAEQALPFIVLLGSLIAFLNLSRRLELVVARAAGVSVWQFLAPAGHRGHGVRRDRGHALQSAFDRDEAAVGRAGGQALRTWSRDRRILAAAEERGRAVDHPCRGARRGGRGVL